MNVNRNVLKFGMFALALLPVGCVGSDPSRATDFLEQKLGGKIGGKPWAVRYAFVDPTIDTPEENDYVFVFLPYKPAEPCPKDTEGVADNRSILVSAPKSTGKPTPLKKGSSRNLVFHYLDRGSAVANAAVRGKIKLNAIDGKTVKGRLMGALNGNNYVNGDFVATICELGDMNKSSPWEVQ